MENLCKRAAFEIEEAKGSDFQKSDTILSEEKGGKKYNRNLRRPGLRKVGENDLPRPAGTTYAGAEMSRPNIQSIEPRRGLKKRRRGNYRVGP